MTPAYPDGWGEAMLALRAAAAAFDRAKGLGLVTLEADGRLFVVDALDHKLPPNPEQLSFDDA